MKSVTLILLIIFFSTASTAQKIPDYEGAANSSVGKTEMANFGLGFGIDYGGFGAKLTVIPEKHIGVFLAGGAMGYNIGGRLRLKPSRRISPTISGMYGVNGILIPTLFEIKTYRGYSVGLGLENKVGRRNNFWKVELLVPFHSAEFDNARTNYNSNGYSLSAPWPVVLSAGFHFAINN